MQLIRQVRINVNHLWLITEQTHGKKEPSGKLEYVILLDIVSWYKSYVNRRLVTKEEMCGKKSVQTCTWEKKILQTSGLKKIHAPKIFNLNPPPFGYF